jgi:hypothetical protein
MGLLPDEVMKRIKHASQSSGSCHLLVSSCQAVYSRLFQGITVLQLRVCTFGVTLAEYLGSRSAMVPDNWVEESNTLMLASSIVLELSRDRIMSTLIK